MKIQSQSNIFEKDSVGAFCHHAPVTIEPSASGLLSNLSYGLKDIYDVAGIPTAFGSPSWLTTHDIPSETAPFIHLLADAGAKLVGKTHTDELTYSILGINAHYGTPINTAAINRVPGGSSSGSAAAVAAGLVDFAIGSDTGGSVRAPASFCGIYGIRTSHGRISLNHARPLAKSFDTLGWFSRDPQTLFKVGQVLLEEKLPITSKKPKFYLLKEAFDVVSDPILTIFKQKISAIFSTQTIEEISIAPQTLAQWAETFRIVQASEIWAQHGQWAENHLADFGPGIKERFEIAKSLDSDLIATACSRKNDIEQYIRGLLSDLSGDDTEAILILPSTGCIAPLLNSSAIELEAIRKQLFQLLCIAGLGGLPQVSLPACNFEHAPLGISLIANYGKDSQLLNIVQDLKIN